MGTMTDAPPASDLRTILKGQYHAALAMLREAVELCPDRTWDDPRHRNRTWQIAYHALYFTRYYGGRDEHHDSFWEGHRRGTQNDDGILGPPDPKSDKPHGPAPYTKAEVLACLDFVVRGVDAAVDDLDLAAKECGFPWYKLTKLEHQWMTVRHLQHHTGQISERIRAEADLGMKWVGSRRTVP